MTSIFNNLSKKRSGGYTLLELVIGIGIVMVLAGIVSVSFVSYTQTQALNNGVDEVIALLDEARSRTVSADGGTTYGVHLESTQAVLFSGTTYVDGASGNDPVTLDTHVQIGSISLAGSGSDVLFDPLTGDTEEYGTFIISRTSTALGEKTLTISEAGAVSSD